MENVIDVIFGSGKELDMLQMSCRALVVFLIALVMIKISGRRSFGVRTALDNIIVILLGALLSRAIVGASPFWSVVGASFVIVLIHRLLGWVIVKSKTVSNFIEGKKICLYENNAFVRANMDKALVCEEDILQGVRKSALTDDMQKIDVVYMERNGEISCLKKNQN